MGRAAEHPGYVGAASRFDLRTLRRRKLRPLVLAYEEIEHSRRLLPARHVVWQAELVETERRVHGWRRHLATVHLALLQLVEEFSGRPRNKSGSPARDDLA